MVVQAVARRGRQSALLRLRWGPWAVALLLAVAAFGLYGLTMGDLQGYEPETAAVSEGLVRAGQLRVLPGSSLAPAGSGQGMVGRGGKLYGRQGLTQPVLEAPFYWLGLKLDEFASSAHRDSARFALLRLFNPLLAAVTVFAVFALLFLRGVSARRALVVAVVSAVATLIWPYSKIGMDTTLMATVAMAFASAAWAAIRPTPLRFSLVGIAGALAINSKPYGAFLLLGLVPLLWGPFRRESPRNRLRLLAACAGPLLLGAAAGGWYNWYRTGSVTDFMNTYIGAAVASPISAVGLYLSPGKGLLFYSPLVILGIVGLSQLRREDPGLAWAIVLSVVANTVLVALSWSWTDETWGPRYLVPSAWLLVLPIAWWARGRRRQRWLAIFAVAGVCIQFSAILTSYGITIPVARALSGGEYVYAYGHFGARIAYGDDGPRWIPGASPLLFQLEVAGAYLKEQITGSGYTVAYRPYRGNGVTINLTHPERAFPPLPDFWWTHTNESNARVLAIVLGLLLLSSTGALVTRWRSSRLPV